MLPAADCYDPLLSRFQWGIPARYNIGVDVCNKWADGSGRLALIHETTQGGVFRVTFDDLRNASNRAREQLCACQPAARRPDRYFRARRPPTGHGARCATRERPARGAAGRMVYSGATQSFQETDVL